MTEKEFVEQNKKDVYKLFNYAMEKRRRIPEIEKFLFKKYNWLHHGNYIRDLIKERDSELEKWLLEEANKDDFIDESIKSVIEHYAEYVIKGRWAEAEKIILERGTDEDIYFYARNVIEGRWPEAENQEVLGQYWPEYCEENGIIRDDEDDDWFE